MSVFEVNCQLSYRAKCWEYEGFGKDITRWLKTNNRITAYSSVCLALHTKRDAIINAELMHSSFINCASHFMHSATGHALH